MYRIVGPAVIGSLC